MFSYWLHLALLLSDGLAIAVVAIPTENQKQATVPPPDTAVTLAGRLVESIVSNKDARPLFFPSEPFAALKDLKNAVAYYNDNLIPAFDRDIARLRSKFAGSQGLAVDSFVMGRCKWKALGSEYNKIPYWSCYRNTISVKDAAGKKNTIPIKVLINWGKDWYITHLGF